LANAITDRAVIHLLARGSGGEVAICYPVCYPMANFRITLLVQAVENKTVIHDTKLLLPSAG
jgi:hypothetical protein